MKKFWQYIAFYLWGRRKFKREHPYWGYDNTVAEWIIREGIWGPRWVGPDRTSVDSKDEAHKYTKWEAGQICHGHPGCKMERVP